jgi:hypothetical protein
MLSAVLYLTHRQRDLFNRHPLFVCWLIGGCMAAVAREETI